MLKELNYNFLLEMLRYCLSSMDNFDNIYPNIKEEYIPTKEVLKVFKTMADFRYLKNKMPNLSFLELKLQHDEDSKKVLVDISKIKKVEEESLLTAFEDFCRRMIFMKSYATIGETFNKGDRELAYNKFTSTSEQIQNFTLKRNRLEGIFKDFEKRTVGRYLEDSKAQEKFFFGIDELDRGIGGVEPGEYFLALGDSGTGKSFFLVHCGVQGARSGGNVLHCQAEGTKRQILARYDSNWTGLKYHDMKVNNFKDEDWENYVKILRSISGEVYVDAVESFSQKPSIRDIRKSLIDFRRKGIKIHLVLVDYLELYNPLEIKWKDETERQGLVSRNLKDIAVEFDCVVGSVTQANRIPKEFLNDPAFVLERDNLADSYAKIRPTDLFFTFNQTKSEHAEGLLRIFVDKAREHLGKFRISIFQSLKNSRFYSKKKTLTKIVE